MKKLSNIYITLVLLLIVQMLSAQNQSQQVPLDNQIKTGVLDNGLTYYVRPNQEPEKRASFYIIQKVGSLIENDDQNGLAHFLEHMALNGTKHFPGKGIISSLEKHGVAFGYNINAYTSFNETVYNLSDIPVDKPGLLDTCLLILNDWSNYLTLSEEEIDAERGVIIEEWRTRRDANFRMMKTYFPVLLQGSKYPERDIIGDLDILETFDYQTLRDFYHSWYRTDLQAVVVVGDFDADEMEQKVISLFSSIPAVENPETLPFFEIPDHKEFRYVLARDEEASQNSIDLYIRSKAIDPQNKDFDYMRSQYVRSLFNSMISTRINELVQKGVPPFINGSINFSSFLKGYNVFSLGASGRANEDSLAFDAIYREAERLRRFGFTAGELERAKSNLQVSWDSYYKDRDKIDNDSYVSSIQSHFLLNEPLASVEFEYNYLKQVLPGITLEELSALSREWMTDDNRVLIVQGPKDESVANLTRDEALEIIENIKNSNLKPYEDVAANESLIPFQIEGSEIVATKNIAEFDALEWTLKNGVKVIYKHADFEKDQVSLSAYSYGGISKVDTKNIPDAEMLSGIAGTYGVGEFDNITLQKMLSGKKASVSFSLSSLSENINGSASPDDLETLFELLYLKFARPRFDPEAHDAIMSRYEALLAQLNNNPQKVMQDSLTLILSDYNPRSRVLNEEYIQEVNIEDIEQIYRERFRDADDFTFIIVGNIDENTLKPLVEKYLGSLKSNPESEKWIDRNIEGPKGLTEKKISMELSVPKSTVVVNFNKDINYNPTNRQAVRVIKGILDLRYNETIREEEGGTYGVGTSLSATQFPKGEFKATISFDCDPARAEELKLIVYSELEALYTRGPNQTDLDKSVNNILKTREESKLHNSYWSSVLFSYYYGGIDYNNPENYEDILHSFTVKDIQKIAKEFFENADVVDLIFEPAKE